MKLFFLSLLFTIRVFSFDLADAAVVGCKANPLELIWKTKASVDIQADYLERFSESQRSEIVTQHILHQIKYLIGISKEYHSAQIRKFALSNYRKNLKILSTTTTQYQLPKLDEYWSSNIQLGSDPYVNFLMNISKFNKKSRFIQIGYSVDLLFLFCTEKNVDTETVRQELQTIPIPKDPYLGFWINTDEERFIEKISGAAEGKIADCISKDFLRYGTTPDNAWFYWEPVHSNSRSFCRLANAHLITHIKAETRPNLPQEKTDALTIQKQLLVSFVFGIVDLKRNEEAADLTQARLKLIVKNLDLCKSKKLQSCLDLWASSVQDAQQSQADFGYISLLNFLKYSSTLINITKINILERGDSSFTVQLMGKTRMKPKSIELRIYHGPSSIYGLVKPTANYWKFILQSLYSSDSIFYFGHAGIGHNLNLKTIAKFAPQNLNFEKRTKDLILGFFSCEGFSYFGYDYEGLFKPQQLKGKNLYILASSGIETKIDFVLGFLEQIIKGEYHSKNLVVQNLNDLVRSKDFLTYQHIKF